MPGGGFSTTPPSAILFRWWQLEIGDSQNYMEKLLIFFVYLLLTQLSFGQKNHLARIPPEPPTKKELETEERNHNCVKRTNKPFTVRLKKYPFNLASQIQFVSFKGGVDTSKYQDMKDIDSLPRLNDTICYSKLVEVKSLTFAQVDKLTALFYNYGYGGPVYIGSISQCYFPRNAILFLDNSGKVFEFIEICFHCHNTKQSSDKISLGQLCDQKMEMLRAIFKQVGVEYGVTRGLSNE